MVMDKQPAHMLNIIKYMRALKELDISSTGLSTKDLSVLLERLNENQDRLRYLNIGYNPIVDDQESFENLPKSKQKGGSSQIDEFMNQFTKYLKESKSLVHLNISGMNLPR